MLLEHVDFAVEKELEHMDAEDPVHKVLIRTSSVVHVNAWLICVCKEDEERRQKNQYKIERIPSQVDTRVAYEILDRLGNIGLRFVEPGALQLELHDVSRGGKHVDVKRYGLNDDPKSLSACIVSTRPISVRWAILNALLRGGEGPLS